MIRIENLIYSYPGSSNPTIKNISFQINKGEIFGFLGPSGAGKSTTQKILIGLLPGYSGNIEVLGEKLSSWKSQYYEHIGVGFELPNHYARLSALENLKFFASFYDKKTQDPIALLEMVDLKNDAKKRVEEYSKGMKMRLNFARALIHDPEILFFDEPTAGLDPMNARKMKDIILSLKRQGKTIFITTHNMHDADELCDRVAFITDGELKLVDAPKQLKLLNGVRKVRVEYTNGESKTREFSLDKLGDNKDFLYIIKKYTLVSMHSEEASLEDIFIKTTGRALK
ncbi:MAG: ABC transporter ATP-binding protein [Bacteroidales bacterium]|nr:ABC transporter ATP-binding protein [Bacteroidales bacterium]